MRRFKLNIAIICLLLFQIEIGFSQDGYVSDLNSESVSTESIYIHSNTSMLFAGEYLYYSLYCFNTETKNLSDLSKMAYVELISSSGVRVFRHKIRLERGRGYSDFFLPVEVETGNYKLIAYTNWMQNSDLNQFGISNINIINPYKAVKAQNQRNETVSKDSLLMTNVVLEKDSDNNLIQLEKPSYDTRERVKISINTSDLSKALKGTFSVSVKHKSRITSPQRTDLKDYYEKMEAKSIQLSELKQANHLPELRGELYEGEIKALNGGQVQDLNVAISFANDRSLFRIARTNRDGKFYFNLDEFYYTEDLFFQVIGEDLQDYKIELKSKLKPVINTLNFETFELKPEWEADIINQSVYNQIENAYFEFRSDSLYIPNKTDFLSEGMFEYYNLDDYNRFNTLKETIQEFVSKVSIGRDENQDRTFQIQGFDYDTSTGTKPLVLLDGIFVDDHEQLMDYNAKTIKDITVYRDQYVIGLSLFQGALVINSINGLDKNEFLQNGFFNQLKTIPPQLQKTYFSQKYDGSGNNNRMPDYRQQLLWLPSLEISEVEDQIIEFYTSDVKGLFEIRLEGFTDEGQPISFNKTFEVN
ncbi:hypothetical protein [Winogradskyella poriferorum]|uniref:hypothetical protein n=1 Tax=Winogradskyella poriferorum TaxID=307627 RepID=UPI003D649FCC